MESFNLPVHDRPSPVYSALHVHSKLPKVFAHIALGSQGETVAVHSLISAKVQIENKIKIEFVEKILQNVNVS